MLSPRQLYTILYEHFGPQYWWPADSPFEVIVGAILTQNTNWQNVEKAIENLKKKKLLSLSALGKAPLSEIKQAIKPSGFYNQKAHRLKICVAYLEKEGYGSVVKALAKDVLFLRNELLSLNGIGPETADSILLYAAHKRIFVIDAYTRRILERVNTVKFKTYDEYRLYFEHNLPADIQQYSEYHALLVKLGKDFCKKKPLCLLCLLKKGCNYGRQTPGAKKMH